MNDRRLAFLYAPEIESLPYPEDCPFKTQRPTLTRKRLISFGLLGLPGRDEVPARKATFEEVGRLHTARYLQELQRAAAGELTIEGLHLGLGGSDTPVFPALLDYGLFACGAGLEAADALLSGKAHIAFNLLGGFHHAMPEKAAGFCFLNDVALACLRLADAGKRVAYLDVDAHHGDGTQAMFYDRSDVFTISLHESGKTLFPWGGFEDEIGEGPGTGFNANLSLPAGCYDEAFLSALDRTALPLIRAYAPDAIVVELGMDTLAGDPLTHLHMTNNVVVDLLEKLMELRKPLLIAGGGGYHVENTVRGWALAWRTACGEGDEDIYSLGLGGVMLGTTEWAGGLRDRELRVTEERRQAVLPELEASIAALQRNLFPRHGLTLPPAAGA
jgi:acetoin utilization protein AcuC